MGLVNLEWENANSLRAYPFREDALFVSTNPELVLPRDAFLDLFAFVASARDSHFYLGAIEIREDFSLAAKIFGVSSQLEIGKAEIPLTAVAGNSFEVVGDGLGTAGKIVVGEGISTIRLWGVGEVLFTEGSTMLEPSTIVSLDAGVVTSIGILGRDVVLAGDVKLKAGRAIELEPKAENNSLVLDALKRVDDCTTSLPGCIIQSVNGIKPDRYGNVCVSAEGILTMQGGAHEATISSIIADDQRCPRLFPPAYRGAKGAAGPQGPRGPKGLNLVCTCDDCPRCPPCDPPPTPPRIITTTPAFPAGFNEGDPVTLNGDSFIDPETREVFVDSIIWCKSNGTYIEVPANIDPLNDLDPNHKIDTTVPVGLTVPPSGDDIYQVRLKTVYGYTPKISIQVASAGGPLQLDSLDAIGNWVANIGSLALITAGQAEGTGAFELTGVATPVGPNFFSKAILDNSVGIPALGGVPWNISSFTDIQVDAALEIDPLLPFGTINFSLALADGSFTSDVIPAVGFPFTYPTPHAISSGDYGTMTFPLGGTPVDLTDVVSMAIVVEVQTLAPLVLRTWVDDLRAI